MTVLWPSVNPSTTALSCPSRVCLALKPGSYLAGLVSLVTNTSLTFSLSYCGSNIIKHFFCEITPLLALSCSDTYISEILLFSLYGFIEFNTILIIFIFSAFILIAIIRLCSSEGYLKTSPPAGLTSLASHFLIAQPSLCIWGQHPATPWIKTNGPLCSTLLSSPCWIPWSTVYGTRMWRLLSIK